MWLDKMMTTRDLIQDSFDDLSYFYDNIKPKEQLKPSVKIKIDDLIEMAFKCHLDPKLNAENDEDDEPVAKVTCHLCLLQNELNKYECVIFDKHLQENKTVSDGSWKPSYQELILKCMLNG
jgi:E3 ubiquitin-protein ligase SHPRH